MLVRVLFFLDLAFAGIRAFRNGRTCSSFLKFQWLHLFHGFVFALPCQFLLTLLIFEEALLANAVLIASLACLTLFFLSANLQLYYTPKFQGPFLEKLYVFVLALVEDVAKLLG